MLFSRFSGLLFMLCAILRFCNIPIKIKYNKIIFHSYLKHTYSVRGGLRPQLGPDVVAQRGPKNALKFLKNRLRCELRGVV